MYIAPKKNYTKYNFLADFYCIMCYCLKVTREQFIKWLDEMKASGLARSARDCAKLLGITPAMITRYKKGDAKISTVTGLACRALLHRMEPYE
jgi:hypothetical protein